MNTEFFRLALVYVHLLICCVAVGFIILEDLSTAKQLWYKDHHAFFDEPGTYTLHRVVSCALGLLWLTGGAIVWFDVVGLDKGLDYFTNPKLQAKIGMVIILTLNGHILSKLVFPALTKTGSLLRLSPSKCVLALFTGAVSGVSWLYTVLLGVGRPLAWKYSLLELLWLWPVAVLAVFLTLLYLVERKRAHITHALE